MKSSVMAEKLIVAIAVMFSIGMTIFTLLRAIKMTTTPTIGGNAAYGPSAPEIRHWRERLDHNKGFYDGLTYHMGTNAIIAAMEEQIQDASARINELNNRIVALTTAPKATQAADMTIMVARENKLLRQVLAHVYAGSSLYSHEGELQMSSGKNGVIDFKRNPIEHIVAQMVKIDQAKADALSDLI